MPERAALVVIDLQNDFCANAALDTVTANAARAVDLARADGTEVVFVRFIGDLEHQGPSWRDRNRALGKRPKCLAGSWGARFHRVSPAPGEHVFTKLACFDAFLSAGFEQHLSRRGVTRLVFAGLYTDVCVDSTARTAFQKGYHVTVLADCTASLHLPDAEILRFMAVLYGARITTLDHPDPWSGLRAGREDGWVAPTGAESTGAESMGASA
ncbi:cysteine hydrolase family protein [Actinokineospora iranica]|uniref:Nicotinamidase-related amidase n=1 Tax=Actinokineospora iranica TaxID=1271860 RepID=A0A1G6JXR7_9PSEU|nr:cysteine hydrolase [Actinokineospora iranica]SDC23579.1 Nicotinamidase-related amidase [Actinokineospora iranica]